MDKVSDYEISKINIISESIELKAKIEKIKEKIKPEIYCITNGNNPYLIYCDLENNKKINFLNFYNDIIEKTIETNFYKEVGVFQKIFEWEKEFVSPIPYIKDYLIVSLEFLPDRNNNINSGYLKFELFLFPEFLEDKNNEDKESYL